MEIKSSFWKFSYWKTVISLWYNYIIRKLLIAFPPVKRNYMKKERICQVVLNVTRSTGSVNDISAPPQLFDITKTSNIKIWMSALSRHELNNI